MATWDDHHSPFRDLARDALLVVLLLFLGGIVLLVVVLSHPRSDVPVNQVPAAYRVTVTPGTTSGTEPTMTRPRIAATFGPA